MLATEPVSTAILVTAFGGMLAACVALSRASARLGLPDGRTVGRSDGRTVGRSDGRTVVMWKGRSLARPPFLTVIRASEASVGIYRTVLDACHGTGKVDPDIRFASAG